MGERIAKVRPFGKTYHTREHTHAGGVPGAGDAEIAQTTRGACDKQKKHSTTTSTGTAMKRIVRRLDANALPDVNIEGLGAATRTAMVDKHRTANPFDLADGPTIKGRAITMPQR